MYKIFPHKQAGTITNCPEIVDFRESYRPPVVKNEDVQNHSLYRVDWRFVCFVLFLMICYQLTTGGQYNHDKTLRFDK